MGAVFRDKNDALFIFTERDYSIGWRPSFIYGPEQFDMLLEFEAIRAEYEEEQFRKRAPWATGGQANSSRRRPPATHTQYGERSYRVTVFVDEQTEVRGVRPTRPCRYWRARHPQSRAYAATRLSPKPPDDDLRRVGRARERGGTKFSTRWCATRFLMVGSPRDDAAIRAASVVEASREVLGAFLLEPTEQSFARRDETH